MKENKTLLPYLALLLAAVLLVLCFLLPYAKATEENREWLEEIGDKVVYEEINMDGNDMVKMSLLEYARVYRMFARDNIDKTGSMTRLVLIIVLAVFCLLTLLFAALKKPIAAIVFAAIDLLPAFLLSEEFSSAGIVPSSKYACGISHALFYLLPLIVIAAAIWLLIARKPKAVKEEN